MQQQVYLVFFLAFISCCYAGSYSSARAGIDTRTETTCQTHKRNAGGRALMEWDIQCDSLGMYMPLQCTKNTPRWCACYNKEEAITSPSRGTKSCECHLARDAAEKKGDSCIPKCATSGKFEKLQCCRSSRKCLCVDPITGVTKSTHAYDENKKC